MKNATVKKINTLGKVTRILVIILNVCLIIAIVGTLIAGIFSLFIPEDSIRVVGTVNGNVYVDESGLSGIAARLTPEGTLVDIAESDDHFKLLGTSVDWNIKKSDVSDGVYSYSIEGNIDGTTSTKALLWAHSGSMFIAALFLGAILAAGIFGKKLASALETCDSPFEEKVIKAMKAFGFSLIPFAAVSLLMNGIGLLMVLAVLVIILFTFIFSYGAELQRESDETL